MLDIILWIIFGGVAGWIASMIMGTNAQQGILGNIIIGILGAFIGGFIMRGITGDEVTGFNFMSLVVAVIGAVLLLAIVKLFRGGKHHA